MYNNIGYMTKLTAMPTYGTNPSKIFFSDFHETWSEALMAKVLQCVYKIMTL